VCVAFRDDPALTLPLLQDKPRHHPLCSDALHSFPAVASQRGGLPELGIEISHETVRYWWNRFGPIFAAELRRNWVEPVLGCKHWRWHLDEVFVKINGVTHFLWRAVDH
jgi:hypothetical protein